jgi:hypothetical protein
MLVLNLKKAFGNTYQIEIEEAYKLERPELKDPIEWYYVIPAKHGQFYPYGGDTIAFYCTANRIKEQILREFQGKVTLFLEGEDESILHFDKEIFHDIALLAKAKKKRGRKALSETEKKRLVEAGKGYQFTGKSQQHTELEEAISVVHDRKIVSR